MTCALGDQPIAYMLQRPRTYVLRILRIKTWHLTSADQLRTYKIDANYNIKLNIATKCENTVLKTRRSLDVSLNVLTVSADLTSDIMEPNQCIETWSRGRRQQTTRAAALRTRCRGAVVDCGRPESTALQ